MISAEYAMDMRNAVLALKEVDVDLAEAILRLHRVAFEAGVGPAAVLIVEGHQIMLEEKEEGNTHYTDVG